MLQSKTRTQVTANIWQKFRRASVALAPAEEAPADVGRQRTEDERGQVAQQLQAGQLPVPQHLLEDGELPVVVGRVSDLAQLLPDEAQVPDEHRLVVGERVEGGLEQIMSR